MFQEIFKGVSRVFQGSSNSVSRTFQRYFKEVLGCMILVSATLAEGGVDCFEHSFYEKSVGWREEKEEKKKMTKIVAIKVVARLTAPPPLLPILCIVCNYMAKLLFGHNIF